MKGVSGEKLSQLSGFDVNVVQVVDLGQSCFTIGRFTTEEGRMVHVVHVLGNDVLTFIYDSWTAAVVAAIKVGYHARASEPEQLSMHL